MLGALFFMASCGGNKPQSEETHAEETHEHEGHDHDGDANHSHEGEVATYVVDAQASNVRWEGGTSGINVYSHFGNIDIQEGSVMVEGDHITGGSFVIDMTSIDPKDEGYSEDNPPSKLVGHLSTDDFFAIEANPTSSFEITSVNENTLTGNLTVRGITNEETVNVENVTMNEDGTMNATGTLVFDRQKYDVAWVHFMEDVLLKDDIELQISLVANK